MQITFSKLEPIAEATIDTEKKLNVIIGENGIGKTYLSIMVYAILHAMTSTPFIHRRLVYNNLFRKRKINAEIKKAETENGYKKFHMNVEDILKLEKIKIGQSYPLDKFVNDVFASGNIKKNFPNLSIEIDLNSLCEKIKQPKDFKFEHNRIKIEKKENQFYFHLYKDIDADDITNILLRYLVVDLIPQPFFFPAERGAINIFNKELSIKRNEALDHLLAISNNKSEPDYMFRMLNRNKRYILPIRESLAFADDIKEISKNMGEFSCLADEIEQHILNGEFLIDKYGQIFFISNKAKTKKISLDMAASSIKTLVGLTLFLRHQAKKGMTIFIDEPELNLHPNAQVHIAKIIVKMINSGLKVFISTHSDYIVRELNNMIIAHAIEYKKYCDSQLHLDKSDIAVTRLYYKEANSRKLTTEYVKIENDGFTVPSIDDVIMDQNDENHTLWNQLQTM